jgi:hypothetical protein
MLVGSATWVSFAADRFEMAKPELDHRATGCGRALCSTLLALCALLGAPPLKAQTATDKAAAEALFDKGKELLTAGRYDEACTKFEGSQKLDSGLGTQLYLADCYEKAGRAASAWATFLEAESLARTRNDQDRADVARQRAAALEPRLSKLWVNVASGNSESLEIRRNGAPIPRPSWGVALPVDGGEQVVEASAPGKVAYKQVVTLEPERATAEVSIPVLEDDPNAVAPTESGAAASGPPGGADADTGPSDESTGSGQRTLGIVVGGVGVVGLALGTVFGLQAKSKNDDSKAKCRPNDPNQCSADGVSLREDAQSAATISTIAFGVGGAALVAGVVLFATAPSSSDSASGPSIQLATRVGPARAGLQLGGTW